MFHHNTPRIAALMILLSTAALPQTGFAASYLEALPRAQKTSYTASLADITRGDTARTTRTLDWRQPALQLYFDLPPAERTSEIVLTLSADPLTRVAAIAPLQVQFNDTAPVPILSNGKGFEARIPFDAALARDHRNSLRIIYPAPSGSDCVTAAHGEWSVDLANSTLKIGGRAKSRNMSLSEVEDRLAHPALSPKKVGLIARGPDGTDMQALAAQGMALRMPSVPKFSVTTQGTDFNIVMVKRDRLFDVTDDPMILNSKGARIFVPKGRPTELIFTAETDGEILRMLEIFSTRHLPSTRRPITSLGEIHLQNRLDTEIVKIERKAHLSELGVGQTTASYRADNWASGAQSYRFSVADPAATGAELLLRLSTTNDVANTSKLRVALNGEILGAAKLNRKRKSVAFDIEAGKLNATSNILSLLPDLEAKSDFTCPAREGGRPSFTLGQGSRLTLKQKTPSPVTELSRLTSTGGIFANTESYIILPRETRDYQAALGVLGRLAKASGHGLTLADYTRKTDANDNRHRLVIGPSSLAQRYTIGAPKALREALNGQSSSGDNLLQANIERFASSGADDFAVQFAAAQLKPRRIQGGGVAALFDAGNGKLTGIISAAEGESFIRSSKQLVQPAHWNALKGGVSRWNNSTVVMAQTAQPAFGIKLPTTQPKFNLSDLSLPNFDRPDLSWPDFSFPKVNLPRWSLPKSGKSDPTEAVSTISVTEPQPSNIRNAIETDIPSVKSEPVTTKMAVVKTTNVAPRLKPTSNVVNSGSTGLRGKFEFETPRMADMGTFQDLRRGTKIKWNATKDWFKTKTNAVKEISLLEDVARATDRLQDQVKPASRSMRNSLKQNAPGKGILQLGDRTVSAYGMLLMLAFGLVLFLMSFAGPSSRLGGRH